MPNEWSIIAYWIAYQMWPSQGDWLDWPVVDQMSTNGVYGKFTPIVSRCYFQWHHYRLVQVQISHRHESSLFLIFRNWSWNCSLTLPTQCYCAMNIWKWKRVFWVFQKWLWHPFLACELNNATCSLVVCMTGLSIELTVIIFLGRILRF